jgi:cell wall-associated NlpC family hydrolase
MVQPAAGYRPTTLPDELPLDSLPGPPSLVSPTMQSSPEPLSDDDLAEASATSKRTAIDVMATQAVFAPRYERDTAIQQRLDAFRDSMTPTYHTSGGSLPVSTAFAMSHPQTSNGMAPTPTALTEMAMSELQSAARRAHMESALGQIRSGRGTPEQIRAITQALIDEGHALPGPDGLPESSVRETMAHYGIGIDCAGYVQQAYLHATGLDRPQARFAAGGDEDLSHLERRGYQRIDNLADVRPGDLVVLGACSPTPADPHPVGHRAIVYDQRLATPADIQGLLQNEGAQSFAVGGPIRLFVLDSSWGCNGIPEVGGARQERWWYNESTGKWAWLGQGNGRSPRPFGVDSRPYGHPCNPPDEGFFRNAGLAR